MDVQTTVYALAVAVAAFLIATFLGRKAEPLSPLSYVPWTGIQFVSIVAMIVFGAHLYGEWRGELFIGTRSPLRGL